MALCGRAWVVDFGDRQLYQIERMKRRRLFSSALRILFLFHYKFTRMSSDVDRERTSLWEIFWSAVQARAAQDLRISGIQIELHFTVYEFHKYSLDSWVWGKQQQHEFISVCNGFLRDDNDMERKGGAQWMLNNRCMWPQGRIRGGATES